MKISVLEIAWWLILVLPNMINDYYKPKENENKRYPFHCTREGCLGVPVISLVAFSLLLLCASSKAFQGGFMEQSEVQEKLLKVFGVRRCQQVRGLWGRCLLRAPFAGAGAGPGR